jgi:hypothetical protein
LVRHMVRAPQEQDQVQTSSHMIHGQALADMGLRKARARTHLRGVFSSQLRAMLHATTWDAFVNCLSCKLS